MKLNKPQLTIHRDGQNLLFQANGSDLDEFDNRCYSYRYTISKCDKVNHPLHFYLIVQDQVLSILTKSHSSSMTSAELRLCQLMEHKNVMFLFLFWSYIFLLLCLQNITVHEREHHVVQYDPACKYRARVQVIFSDKCGAGSSDPSDEVEYGTSGPSNLYHNLNYDNHSLFSLSKF